MKKFFASTLAFALFTSVSMAQVTTELFTVGSDVSPDPNSYAAFGDTGFGPNGLVQLSTGSYAFFDTDGTGAAADSMVLFDPSGTGAARFSIILDEASAIASGGTADGNVGITGLVKDPTRDDLYILYVGTTANNYFVLFLDSTGADTWAAPTVFISDAEIDAALGTTAGFNNRLYVNPFTTPEQIVVMSTAGTPASNGFAARGIGTTDPLTVLATFAELGAATTPDSSANANFVSYIPVSADEFIAINIGTATVGAQGDFVRYNTLTDTATLFAENDTITNGEANVTNSSTAGSAALLLTENNTVVNGLGEDIINLNLTTGAVSVIATEAQIEAGFSVPTTDISTNSSAFYSSGNNIFGLLINPNGFEALVEIDATVSSVSDWNLYNEN